MEYKDVIVVGGGVSGLAFAYHAATAGRDTLVLEGASRAGGCIDTRRLGSGYWFEMGAHTCYNSYGGLIEIAEGSGIADRILPRGEARKTFGLLRDGVLTTMGPLSVFLQFDGWELLRSAPLGLLSPKKGQTTYAWYSRVVGKRNYDEVLGPFLAAVPSQSADAFPASGPGSLFKKRPRRKDVTRSFTFRDGLGSVVDAVAGRPGVDLRTGVVAREVRRTGDAYEVVTSTGGSFASREVALAVPPSMAAALLRGVHPELAAQLSRVKMATVETVGVVVPREKARVPEAAFLVPLEDVFHSAVTRDTVPDTAWRAFAFHFKPGQGRAEKLARVAGVLGVGLADLEQVEEKTTVLPSPVLGHDAVVREIDRLLEGSPLALTGNYFEGLAIEDCVQRSRSEWRRVAGLR
jgi:protoporphyrinogen/coproporphyrinogen III oxidase